MAELKFKLTSESKVNLFGIKLFRIEATVSFRDVKKGDKGGWIESEEVSGNARVSGNAWVSGDAQVSGNAWVSGDAQVSGNARVSGDAQVSGNAWVSGDARVSGNAWVSGDAQVSGNAWVSGDAQVSGNAWVSGDAQVSGNARVSGDAQVSGNAWVSGDAQVSGNAWVSGDARVSGNAWVSGDAQVSGDIVLNIKKLFKKGWFVAGDDDSTPKKMTVLGSEYSNGYWKNTYALGELEVDDIVDEDSSEKAVVESESEITVNRITYVRKGDQ